MRIDELTRPEDIGDASPILRLHGWETIGAGYFANVYGKEGKDYILKLFDPLDRAYRAFLDLMKEHPNRHFPRLVGKPIRVTQRYWAVRMEKLLPSSTPISLSVYLIAKKNGGPNPRNSLQVDAYREVMAYLEDQPDLRTALDLIADNLLTRFNEDLHRENFMERQDGTIVITDPVS